MIPYSVGKTVLDLGCVGYTWTAAKNDRLHGDLCINASEVLGLDYLEADVAKLKKLGYHIICGNAENFDLGRTFDVIVAAESIEHLENFRGFL